MEPGKRVVFRRFMGKDALLLELEKLLEPWQLEQLVEGLRTVTRLGYGDVRLVVVDGRVKFVGFSVSYSKKEGE